MDRRPVSLVLPCRAFLVLWNKKGTICGLVGRAEGLCGQGGCIYVVKLQAWLKWSKTRLAGLFQSCFAYSFVSLSQMQIWLPLVGNNETFPFTTQCKLQIKLCTMFCEDCKSRKNMHIVLNLFFQILSFTFYCVKMLFWKKMCFFHFVF